MNTITFGLYIRCFRIRADLTQRELADALGIHFTYLSKIENDTVSPGEALVRDLAKVFEVDTETLLAIAGKVDVRALRKIIAKDWRVGVIARRLQEGGLTGSQVQKMYDVVKDGRHEAG